MKEPLKIYRVTFRVKVGHLPLVGEVNFETRKHKWEIDHEAIVQKYLDAAGGLCVFDAILDAEEIK